LEARILNHFIANSKFIDKAILKGSLVLLRTLVTLKRFAKRLWLNFTLN
jgi:hypothetical protein